MLTKNRESQKKEKPTSPAIEPFSTHPNKLKNVFYRSRNEQVVRSNRISSSTKNLVTMRFAGFFVLFGKQCYRKNGQHLVNNSEKRRVSSPFSAANPPYLFLSFILFLYLSRSLTAERKALPRCLLLLYLRFAAHEGIYSLWTAAHGRAGKKPL